MTTNYEATVPLDVRDHIEALMGSWRDEGRDDDRIEMIVRSLALAAYAAGQRDVRMYLTELLAQPYLRRPGATPAVVGTVS